MMISGVIHSSEMKTKTHSLTHIQTHLVHTTQNSWEKENAVSPPTCKSPHVKGAVLNCSSSDKKYRELLNLYNDETHKKNKHFSCGAATAGWFWCARACTLLRCIRNSREIRASLLGISWKTTTQKPVATHSTTPRLRRDTTKWPPLPRKRTEIEYMKKAVFPCVCVRFSWAQSAVVRMLCRDCCRATIECCAIF